MKRQGTEIATFAAGCFWAVEESFRKVKGVISTKVGYTGGTMKNPTYKDVCTGKTGHAEAIKIDYDAGIITYDELLKLFWEIHDPTTLNRQGPDVGTQYRSAIFYHNDEQRDLAIASKQKLESSGKFIQLIVTEIAKATEFYEAEEYHQKYYLKKGRAVAENGI
jgi:peptide-methionine (S)-S-oxide reductase